MTPFARFEAAFAVGAGAVFIAGTCGILAIWTLFSIIPVVVTHVDPMRAAALLSVAAAVFLFGVLVVHAAHGLLQREWLGLLACTKDNQTDHWRGLTGWVGSLAPVVLWSFPIIPMLFVLLVISPWLGVVVVGALYGFLAQARTARAAHASYVHLKLTSTRSQNRNDASLICPPFVLLVGTVAALALLMALLAVMRPEIDGTARATLASIRQQASERRQSAPRMQTIYRERVDLERSIYAHEQDRLTRKQGSQAEVDTARSRLMALETEAEKWRIENSDLVARLDRDALDLESKLKSLSSAAPALSR